MAKALSRAFAAPLVTSTISRLVVDLNRSIGHPQHFSATTRAAPSWVRTKLVARYYRPYRMEVERLVRQSVARGQQVIHVSSHSFTPELDGNVRHADVGLLYDPARQRESDLCARWKASLGVIAPHIRVRRNYPYAGKGDGLTSAMRLSFPVHAYVGIELEVNQKIVFGAGRRWTALRSALIESLRMACAGAGRHDEGRRTR
jgi:predicted N-formylglutamate amidohydrolase